MAEEDMELTHDEIWDDSALVDSWNQALEEYKKYHSIYAGSKGRQSPVPPNAPQAASTASAPGLDAADVPESEKSPTAPGPGPSHRETSVGKQETSGGADGIGIAPPPVALMGSVQDEGLKSLLMAWYYAGYYTGLYEGQQRSQAQAPQDQEKEDGGRP